MDMLFLLNVNLLPEHDIKLSEYRARIFIISLLLRAKYSQSLSKPRGPS